MKNLLMGIISLFILFAITNMAHSAVVPTPEALKGGQIISLEEVKSMIDQKTATIFDVRNAINYGKGHLPGAISLNFSEKVVKVVEFDPPDSTIDLSKLPADKNAPVVFYSHGDTGWKSYIAAVVTINSGYKNVMWFKAGFSEWKSNNNSIEFGH